MLSRFAMASARCVPIVRDAGSLNCGAAGGVSAVEGAAAPAGDGVDGILMAFEVVVWIGAAGGAGVAEDAGAGVDGTFDEDAVDAGAGLG